MQPVKETANANPPAQTGDPESRTSSDEPSSGGDPPDLQPDNQAESEWAAKRQAALSATFYHWFLSRL